MQTFPNLYCLLVGPPTSGKSVAITAGRDLVRPETGEPVIDPEYLLPNKVTVRRMTALMSNSETPEGKVDIVVPRQKVMAKKVAFIREWSDFMDPLDQKARSTLTDLWDCPHEYEYETQHVGKDIIYNVYAVVLGGVQPYWFGQLPPSAFEQGFMTRMIMVASEEAPRQPLFGPAAPSSENNAKVLQSRFSSLCATEGEFYWYPAAQERLGAWYEGGCEPVPIHHLLRDYTGRRDVMAAKLAMISGASRTGKLVVGVEDVERALEWLTEAEATAPLALRDAGASSYHGVERGAMNELHAMHARSGKPVDEQIIRRNLARALAPHMVESMIEGLIAQGRLIAVGKGKSPRRRFLPISVSENE